MISIIICTYNRARYVYNVLKSLAENDFPRDGYEILLVNNNSTDTTAEECERFRKDYPGVCFRYLLETQQGLSYARNCGIRNAAGDLIIYVDDDAKACRDFLRTYAEFFSRMPEAEGAGGPVVPEYEDCEEPVWMSRYTQQLVTGSLNLGEKECIFQRGKYPIGCNSAFRKAVFDRVGLFDVNLGRKGNNLIGSEEKDLFDKMSSQGMKFYYLPGAVLYHQICARKLTDAYFNELTYGIGVSERYRTQLISRAKYAKRLFSEAVKWGGTLVLSAGYFLKGQAPKAKKLLIFRRNVTRGLLGLSLSTPPAAFGSRP